jgi:hypothetical protein
MSRCARPPVSARTSKWCDDVTVALAVRLRTTQHDSPRQPHQPHIVLQAERVRRRQVAEMLKRSSRQPEALREANDEARPSPIF